MSQWRTAEALGDGRGMLGGGLVSPCSVSDVRRIAAMRAFTWCSHTMRASTVCTAARATPARQAAEVQCTACCILRRGVLGMVERKEGLRTELGVVSLSGSPVCTSGVVGGPSAAGGVVLSAAIRAEIDDCVCSGSGVA
jgi:hypothetical protein